MMGLIDYIKDTLDDFDENKDETALGNILVYIQHEKEKQTKE